MYVVLARALATGQGYRWINLPDAPLASHFPPGFPLVLAALWRVGPAFPANLVLFKAFNALCLLASTVLVAQLTRERFESERWGAVVGALTAIGVPLLVLVTMVLSEPLFLVLLLLTLLLGERALSAEPSPRRAFAIGLLIGVSMLVRAHGLVLALAFVIVLVRRARTREAMAVIVGALILVGPWQLWGVLNRTPLAAPLAGNYGSYVGWWFRGLRDIGVSMIPQTVEKTVLETSGMFIALLSPARNTLAHAVTLVATGVAIGAGAWTLVRRSPLTATFLLAYAVIVFVWPFSPSRFFWGIWPLIILLFAAAAWSVSMTELWPRSMRFALAAASAWIALGYGLYEVRAIRGQWWSSISRAATNRIATAVRWTDANTAPNDVVAADDEGAIFLYSGRRTVPVASFTAAQYLSNRSAATEAEQGLVPLIARYPVRVVIVGSTKSFEAAQYLVTKPQPILAPHDAFVDGASFTVIRK
jgi:hypothetical protein